MKNRRFLLPAIFFIATGVIGCQTTKNEQLTPSYNLGYKNSGQASPVTWKKSAKIFDASNDRALDFGESRVIFFRDFDDNNEPNNINVKIGNAERFHTSLQEGHYSEAISCKESQMIIVKSLNRDSGEVLLHSIEHDLIPQATTYLQVGSSKTNEPFIKQISTGNALLLLDGSQHQNHQMSRVSSGCKDLSRTLVQMPITINDTALDNQVQVQPLIHFNGLSNFDNNIFSNDVIGLEGVTNYSQTYSETYIKS